MIRALKFLWNNFSYFLAALAVALAVYFFSYERPKALPPVSNRSVPRDFAPGSYAVRSGLMGACANLAAYKGKIEKKLESRFIRSSFTAADADAIGKLARDIEPFLLKLRRNASAADYISQLGAAEAERRTLVLENAKLKSLIKNAGSSSGRVPGQLAAVEESLYRLQLHLEGLAALQAQ
ncbi:MAG: hypothetical protein HY796_13025 [Elusimicrobia bacterium]|nr:hypothetical protein [Elusimicrobiota bacterium]